jgi:hypothetical protein
LNQELFFGLFFLLASFFSEVFSFAVLTARASIREIVSEGTPQEDEGALVAFFSTMNSFLAAFGAEKAWDGPCIGVCHHRYKLVWWRRVVLQILKVCALAGLISGLAVGIGAFDPNQIGGVNGLYTGWFRGLLLIVNVLFVGYGCGQDQADHDNCDHTERFFLICHVGTSNIIG